MLFGSYDTRQAKKEAVSELHAPICVQQQRRYNVRTMPMHHVTRKVISHPTNPMTYVLKLPDLCTRLYIGACTERKLDDVRPARLVLHVPITAVLLLELRNLLLAWMPPPFV